VSIGLAHDSCKLSVPESWFCSLALALFFLLLLLDRSNQAEAASESIPKCTNKRL
jgi:hypothetical protein